MSATIEQAEISLKPEILPQLPEGKTAEAFTLQRRAYGDYSRDQIGEALALVTACAGNVNEASRISGIPHQTIRHWIDRQFQLSDVERAKGAELAQKLENIAHNVADAIMEHDLAIVPLSSKATTLGIVIDKMQLLRGQPTAIVAETGRNSVNIIIQAALATVDEAIDVTPDDPAL